MTAPALTPQFVLHAYTVGAFPMASGSDPGSAVNWYTADPRALIPLDDRFRVRRSLAQAIKRRDFALTFDRAFDRVIAACAEPREAETGSWINPDIVRVYIQLFEMGYAHSVEAWIDTGDAMELVGGLYGVSIGAAFFGESMFSRKPFASQVALVHLVEHLRAHRFELLDCQFTNPHLEQFGVEEIVADAYLERLRHAVHQPPCW